jgi:hypothetical protein
MRHTMMGVLAAALTIPSLAALAGEPPGQAATPVAPPDGSAQPAQPASAEASARPPAEAPSPSATPSASTTPMDPALLAQLQAAAGADEQTVKAQNAGALGGTQPSAPAQPELGKGVVGNETNPAMAFIVDAAGAWFSQDARIHQEGHTPHQTGPVLQGAELAIQAPVDPFFRVFAAVEVAHMELEEAYATTTSLPLNLQVRAGKFLSMVGRHNPTHPHQWKFATTPLPNEFLFGGEGMALPGGELSVLLPVPWYVEIVGAVQAGEAGSYRTRTEGSGEPTYRDFVYPARLVQFFDLADDWALQVGLNTVQGRSSAGERGADRTQAYGADLFLKWRPIGQGATGYTYISTTVEGWYRTMDVVGGDRWKDAGGYAEITFGIDKEWDTGIRGELWRRLDDLGVPEERQPFGIDATRGTAQVSFMPSHFSRIRAQYAFEKTELFPDNHIGLLQLEVAAGAHGAHTY